MVSRSAEECRVVPGRGGADIGEPLNYSTTIAIPLQKPLNYSTTIAIPLK